MSKLVKSVIDDMVVDFMYNNRQEDEDLPICGLTEMFNTKEITVDECAAWFKETLHKYLYGPDEIPTPEYVFKCPNDLVQFQKFCDTLVSANLDPYATNAAISYKYQEMVKERERYGS